MTPYLVLVRGFLIFGALLLTPSKTAASPYITGDPLPFDPTPESFARWMSTNSYSSPAQGSGKYEFVQFSGCRLGTVSGPNAVLKPLGGLYGGSVVVKDDPIQNPYSYSCRKGYTKELSPMGLKVCRINNPSANSYFHVKNASPAKPKSSFGFGECRYLPVTGHYGGYPSDSRSSSPSLGDIMSDTPFNW